MTVVHDVAVVGAGVVGCAIAHDLVAAGFDVALVEATADVGTGTSKANTAIWHTGFDAPPGTLEARLVARGHALLAERSASAGWALEQTGALLVAWDQEQLDRLPTLVSKSVANGYVDIEPLTDDDVYRLEPHLGAGVLGGLLVPGEGLLDPWSITLQLANEAVVNGLRLILNAPVAAVRRGQETFTLAIPGGSVAARWVIDAAGLRSDDLDRMLGHDSFRIAPRRGQLLVFDKLARTLLSHIILPVPTATTKGVLISPTIYGNVLLGPTAEELTDKTATQTTADGIAQLRMHAKRVLPELLSHEVTAAYAGIRAATDAGDYCYATFPDQRYIRVAGIRSTGISSALAIAEHVVADLAAAGESPPHLAAVAQWRVPPIAESSTRPFRDADLIASDPDYGEIVCHCERTTLGEIKAALASPVPPVDLDGLRRRTRVLMGRCQGFFCAARVCALLDEGVTR